MLKRKLTQLNTAASNSTTCKVIKPVKTKCNMLSATLLACGLSACGGTGQDDGSSNSAPQTIELNGIVLDGYVARSTVYVDTNNDGTRNAWEPFAFTDNSGYYSFNPITNVNYCAQDADASLGQFCLRFNRTLSNTIIRVDGGYDISTGEPFISQLSRRFSETELVNTQTSGVISPLTSVLTNIESDEDRSTLLTSMGINSTDLDIDYFNADGSGGVNTNLLNTALKIHKTVTVLSDRLTDTYIDIGEEIGTPNDASPVLYPNLAQELITSTSSLDSVLSDTSSLVNILDSTEEQLRTIYTRKELNLPLDMGDASNPNQFTRVASLASRISSVVDSLITKTVTPITNTDINGRAKALEILVNKTLSEENIDTSIDNAINFFNDSIDNDALDTLITQLTPDSASITPLTTFGFNDNQTTPEQIENVVQSGIGDSPFVFVGGQTLKISDLDLGSEPNNLRDIEAEFYFDGDTTAVDGDFTTCLKVIEDVSRSDLTVGSSNTRGAIATGFWSKLSPDDQGETYSLILTLTFLGSTYQTIIQNAPNELVINPQTGQETDYFVVRADTTDEVTTLYSEQGLVQTASVPTTDQECEQRLPSRIDF